MPSTACSRSSSSNPSSPILRVSWCRPVRILWNVTAPGLSRAGFTFQDQYRVGRELNFQVSHQCRYSQPSCFLNCLGCLKAAKPDRDKPADISASDGCCRKLEDAGYLLVRNYFSQAVQILVESPIVLPAAGGPAASALKPCYKIK